MRDACVLGLNITSSFGRHQLVEWRSTNPSLTWGTDQQLQNHIESVSGPTEKSSPLTLMKAVNNIKPTHWPLWSLSLPYWSLHLCRMWSASLVIYDWSDAALRWMGRCGHFTELSLMTVKYSGPRPSVIHSDDSWYEILVLRYSNLPSLFWTYLFQKSSGLDETQQT